jgi:hypothetical protein
VLVSESGDTDLVVPRLPVRASIYIAPDGTVHFGALFQELVPVANALGFGDTIRNSEISMVSPNPLRLRDGAEQSRDAATTIDSAADA